MSNRRFWLFTSLALIVVTVLLGLAAGTYYQLRAEEDAARELTLLAQLRRGALERYLRTAESEIRFWATNGGLLDIYNKALADWEKRLAAGVDPGAVARRAYIDNNPYPLGRKKELVDNSDGTEYTVQHARAQPLMQLLLEERGYYDFFAITPAGDVLYTIEKEDDYGTNLLTGPYSESGLGEVFRKAMAAAPGSVVFIDIASYAPSNDAPAMFMATPVVGDSGEMRGVWALQLPIDGILEVMQASIGLGETGETYVVGEDLLMRSDSRFFDESTVLDVLVDSATVHRALAGESGVAYTMDYRGVEVLSAFTSIDINGGRWAVMSEVDRAEVVAWGGRNRPQLIGLLLLGCTLASWSVWYVRRAAEPAAGNDIAGVLDIDIDPA